MEKIILFIKILFLMYTILLNSIFFQVDSNIIAIEHANVIKMDSFNVLEDYTVIIVEGVIHEIGPSESVVRPSGAFIIDARNKFLLPGLTDMHIHVWDTDYFINFMANGVTTVRNMWDEVQHISWREQIRNGTILGPELYTTGQILEGNTMQLWNGLNLDN